MASKTDKIKLNAQLKSLKKQGNKVVELDFGDFKVKLGEQDKVILALDNNSCAKFVAVNTLEHSPIINITYFTSQTIFLPRGASFVAQKTGLTDFVFVNDGMITAVISDYHINNEDTNDIAVKVWKEIDAIRGVDSAFMPEYKISYNPRATIKQDTTSNLLRPKDAKTEYSNVFIAGDWTMRNYPCCMEVAVKSAQRAVKTALKLK